MMNVTSASNGGACVSKIITQYDIAHVRTAHSTILLFLFSTALITTR